MSCLNPRLMACIDLNRFPLMRPRLVELGWKVNNEDYKAYRMISKETRHLMLEKIPEYVNCQVYETPCGNCVACRLEYSKNWANRCSLEASQYQCNYFITLTYDDDFIKRGKYDNPTLDKDDQKKFIKRLRNLYLHHYDFTGIRYFGCGEYGDKGFRPHYHVIMFNLPIDDLTEKFPQPDGTFIRKREKMTGRYYLYSPTIQKLWPYGYVVIADCNWNTEAYVSRYVMKKQKGVNASIYEDKLGVLPPYLFMSTNPGIGTKYFLDHYQYYVDNPYLIIPRPYKSTLHSGLPRAFKKRIKVLSPEIYQQMVDKAKDDILKSRSLIAGKYLINSIREAQEGLLKSKSLAFNRNFI